MTALSANGGTSTSFNMKLGCMQMYRASIAMTKNF
jgi:hypothetical protein